MPKKSSSSSPKISKKSPINHQVAIGDEAGYLVNNRGRVEIQPIVGEMKTSYLDYAMSVIVSRALPDVRDGLKPVHVFYMRCGLLACAIAPNSENQQQ